MEAIHKLKYAPTRSRFIQTVRCFPRRSFCPFFILYCGGGRPLMGFKYSHPRTLFIQLLSSSISTTRAAPLAHPRICSALAPRPTAQKTRAIVVGRDYPSPNGKGLKYVRRKWKEGLCDPENFCLLTLTTTANGEEKSPEDDNADRTAAMENKRVVRKAVVKGCYMSTILYQLPKNASR